MTAMASLVFPMAAILRHGTAKSKELWPLTDSLGLQTLCPPTSSSFVDHTDDVYFTPMRATVQKRMESSVSEMDQLWAEPFQSRVKGNVQSWPDLTTMRKRWYVQGKEQPERSFCLVVRDKARPTWWELEDKKQLSFFYIYNSDLLLPFITVAQSQELLGKLIKTMQNSI